MPTSSPTAATSRLAAGGRDRPRTRHGLKKRTSPAECQPTELAAISQMPLISSMIDTSLNDTREHLGTLS
jgi:hypothetical protein